MVMSGKHLFTSESVTEGHPDKVADQISDAVLDAVMADDPEGRVACETLVNTGMVLLAGEITTTTQLNFPEIARETVKAIGYTDAAYGFDSHTCAVVSSIDRQSPDIAMGVDTGGAGDQGLMFGYASDETPELMPMPIVLAHKICRQLARLRKDGTLAYLLPDGKSQVSIVYDGAKPVRVDTVVVSTQHAAGTEVADFKDEIIEQVVKPVVPAEFLDGDTIYHVNPTGRFVVGGPQGDCGLTGRKIIVDTYGGMGHHGGGAFSGKDPSKVDRSASYMARHIAKNLVAAGLCRRVEVQIAYAIGVADPVSLMVNTFGTGTLDEARLVTLVREHFPLTPRGIIEYLDLRRPIYRPTAAYGHFGRDEENFSWERTNKADTLKTEAGN